MITRIGQRLCVALLATACGESVQAVGGGSESSSGTAVADTGSATDSGSSTGDAADSSSGAAGSSGASESTGPSGSSESDSGGPSIECEWFEQPNGEREWGRCTPSLSWADAEAHCVTEGAHLVSLASASENVFAINVLTGVNEAWIGLSDLDRAAVYTWSDGTPYAYMNWDDTQPDNPEHRCTLIGVSQRWFDNDCDDARTFVCARPL